MPSTNPNSYIKQQQRAAKRKQLLIALKGGRCQVCGYNKNVAALCFHHDGDKTQSLDARHLSNTRLEKIMEEVAKCQLLCSNCHMETHYPHLNQ